MRTKIWKLLGLSAVFIPVLTYCTSDFAMQVSQADSAMVVSGTLGLLVCGLVTVGYGFLSFDILQGKI